MELYQIILLLSITTTLLPLSLSSTNINYTTCSNKFTCPGIVGDIGYPFYDGSTRPDYCGYPGFQLDCSEDTPQMNISGKAYYVESIDSNAYNIKVSRTDNWTDYCPDILDNTTIDFSKFNFTSSDQNITFFYDCTLSKDDDLSSLVLTATCDFGGSRPLPGYYLTQAMVDDHKDMIKMCNSNIFIPILESLAKVIDDGPSLGTLTTAVLAGFELGLIAENDACGSCKVSGGECGYNWDSKKFACHCTDADYDFKCTLNSSQAQDKGSTRTTTIGSKSSNNTAIILIAILVGSGIVLGLPILLSFCVVRCCVTCVRKCKSVPKNQRVEDMLKNYESLVPRRYTYANIKKITNSFREKLGEGGYGTVFKGKLQDGRLVAVKVSKQSKGDGHEFANEVVSICSTSHINVVPLLGFCFEGDKGALLYEFMPNGSLEKFIHRRDFNKNDQALSFHKLFEIAVGIAKGLEYLHRDCNTRIVHFDIKPHNILLDEDFVPKISDFGLAKPFKQKESIISISGARGTAGYIAPEVFFSSYGGASHKSDVYSYGMMVLEMVGCTKRPDENVENSSELYFPRWIYKQLEQGAIVNCVGRVLNDEDKELERKMVLVGLWCIQTNPRSRPSMRRVLGMLEGEVELEVPPMPSLASPSRQQQQPPTDDGSASFLSSTSYAS